MNRLAPHIRQALIQNSLVDNRKTWSLGALAAMTKSKEYSCPMVAETLLREVNHRLALQHGKCLEMINIISSSSSSYENDDRNIIRAVNVHIAKNSSSSSSSGTNGISTTTNTNIQMKQDIVKKLNLLQAIHADTFAITQDLLSPPPSSTTTNTTTTTTTPKVFSRFSKADQHVLAATFEQIRSRHASTIENLADIIIEWRQYYYNQEIKNQKQKQDQQQRDCNLDHPDVIMDQFLKDRLGIQLLCDHYVGLSKGRKGGAVSVHCDVHQVLLEAITESKHVCDANYGIAPNVHVIYKNDNVRMMMKKKEQEEEEDVMKVTLIRPWVYHAMVELLKNGMASSIQHMMATTMEMNHHNQPLDLFVQWTLHPERPNNMMLVCEIMDQGIGFQNDPEKEIQHAFQFATSGTGTTSSSDNTNSNTKQQRWDRLQEQQSYAMVRSPISSLGVGLSLSRMMMQRFGGNVELKHRSEPMQILMDSSNTPVEIGSGCTAYLSIPLRDDIDEVL